VGAVLLRLQLLRVRAGVEVGALVLLAGLFCDVCFLLDLAAVKGSLLCGVQSLLLGGGGLVVHAATLVLLLLLLLLLFAVLLFLVAALLWEQAKEGEEQARQA
jgi:uncharacterized membrane protein